MGLINFFAKLVQGQGGVWQRLKLKRDDNNGGSSANGAIGEFSAVLCEQHISQ